MRRRGLTPKQLDKIEQRIMNVINVYKQEWDKQEDKTEAGYDKGLLKGRIFGLMDSLEILEDR